VGDVTRRRLLGPLWPVPAARRSIRSLDRGAGGLGWRPGRSDARGSTVQRSRISSGRAVAAQALILRGGRSCIRDLLTLEIALFLPNSRLQCAMKAAAGEAFVVGPTLRRSSMD